jgi:hypothetical protein
MINQDYKVSNFEKIAEKIREKRAELSKQKRYDRLRKKLNKELFQQNNLRKNSIQDDKKPGSSPPAPIIDEKPPLITRRKISFANTLEVQREMAEAARRHEEMKKEEHALVLPNVPMVASFINTPQLEKTLEESFVQQKDQRPSIMRRSFSHDKLTVKNDFSHVGSRRRSMSLMTRDDITIAPSFISDTHSINAHFLEIDNVKLIAQMKDLLSTGSQNARDWERILGETMGAFVNIKKGTMWPRDTVFNYFRVMQLLQENLKEYQELQSLCNNVLLDLHEG